jgi:hypothetical protein
VIKLLGSGLIGKAGIVQKIGSEAVKTYIINYQLHALLSSTLLKMTVVQPNIRMLQSIVNYELTALAAETV